MVRLDQSLAEFGYDYGKDLSLMGFMRPFSEELSQIDTEKAIKSDFIPRNLKGTKLDPITLFTLSTNKPCLPYASVIKNLIRNYEERPRDILKPVWDEK